MKAFKKIFTLLVFTVILFSTSACTVNKKKKCDTCPKWTSMIHKTSLALPNCV